MFWLQLRSLVTSMMHPLIWDSNGQAMHDFKFRAPALGEGTRKAEERRRCFVEAAPAVRRTSVT